MHPITSVCCFHLHMMAIKPLPYTTLLQQYKLVIHIFYYPLQEKRKCTFTRNHRDHHLSTRKVANVSTGHTHNLSKLCSKPKEGSSVSQLVTCRMGVSCTRTIHIYAAKCRWALQEMKPSLVISHLNVTH